MVPAAQQTLPPSQMEVPGSTLLMLVLSVITAVQRFVKVWRQASAERDTPYQRRAARRRQLRVERRAERRQRLVDRRRAERRPR